MNALVNVLVDEVLIPRCHENGDCQEPDDRDPERSHVWSELLQSSGDCQSERFVIRLCLLVTFSRKLLQSFLKILGPTGFLHEGKAAKQQSKSSAE